MTAPQEVLQDGFARFVHAAEELEASYASLRQRAASVDDELQQTNAKLEQALAERDGMFAALPIGLVLVRADGREVGASNVEADRLVEAPLEERARHRSGNVATKPLRINLFGSSIGTRFVRGE